MMARGFTALEVLMTMTIVAAVATVAVPKRDDFARQGRAAQILAEVETVRAATYRFYSDSGYFPTEVGGGNIPANLNQYLPLNYSFKKPGFQIDYENWTLKYTPVYSKSPVMIGVSVTPVDAKVGMTAFTMYGNAPKFTVGGKYTFIVVGM